MPVPRAIPKPAWFASSRPPLTGESVRLHRNLGNLANPELYKHTHIGTKFLIDDYITEVTSLLNHLCDSDIPELPYSQKMMFFRHTGQSFGRSALMLRCS